MNETGLSRRGLLIGGVATGATLLIPGALRNPALLPDLRPTPLPMPAPIPVATPVLGVGGVERRLAFRCAHTGHACDAVFMRGDAFDDAGLAELDQGLRDWRTRESIGMDRDLFVLLARLRDKLEISPRTPFTLISGFRAPATNAALGARSHQVASMSQHVLGKAVDIALPGVPTARIQAAALALRGGGVGHYPADGFVHLDTGRVRFW